ncbi:serine hydrolase family protein [Staphylococcus chromogenes]|uniref:RBBP9/YdeN family alpha/beta hydrolase n=1 Tax=Staphylococcus chromogenes TaxID=46126 RepID=UPI00118D548B|nr:alpha/beta hydrolase [Staphylococcus chromogenes]QDW91339.1 serine hydrolase family protein [Staphylococcus chromogenes]QDX00504.1 serine hydrolase family protein [Staphylococcus chromogenes]
MTNVYIVYGYHANENKHWFKWLKNALELEGHDVKIIDLPNPDAPDVEEWLTALKTQATAIDGDTLFVAHSLGVITTLKFINDLNVSHIGGIAMVSGFKDYLPHLPELNPFMDQNIDFDNLKQKLNHRFCIASKNDETVPYSYTEELSHSLDAKLYTIEQGGHFCEEDGYETFSFLKQKIILKLD